MVTKATDSGSRPVTAEMFAPLRLAERTEDYFFGTWHHMVIVVWQKETTLAGVRNLEACMRAHAQALEAPITFFSVVEREASMPSTEARKLSAEVLRRVPIRLSALAFEGSGFRAATIRGVVTAIGMLANPPYLHRAFGSVEEAAAWIEAQTRNDGYRAMSSVGVVRSVKLLRVNAALESQQRNS